MKLSLVELGILKSALSEYIAIIQDNIEDNMKAYDGNIENTENHIIKMENYLSDVEKVFHKIRKEYINKS